MTKKPIDRPFRSQTERQMESELTARYGQLGNDEIVAALMLARASAEKTQVQISG